MNKEQLARLSLDINTLFYNLFDKLNEQEKAILQKTLETIQEIQKGDF